MQMTTHDPDAIVASVGAGRHRGATTVIAPALLEDGWLVEIEAVAAA